MSAASEPALSIAFDPAFAIINDPEFRPWLAEWCAGAKFWIEGVDGLLIPIEDATGAKFVPVAIDVTPGGGAIVLRRGTLLEIMPIRCTGNIRFAFASERDAMLFKLRWC